MQAVRWRWGTATALRSPTARRLHLKTQAVWKRDPEMTQVPASRVQADYDGKG